MPSYMNTAARKSAARAALDAQLAKPTAEFVQNFTEVLQVCPTATLVGFLRSGIDPRLILAISLADRGLDQDGTWIGFAEAERALVAKYPEAEAIIDGTHDALQRPVLG